jgi:hypothetical protein
MALLEIELTGSTNVGAEGILRNIATNIRRPLPQARPYEMQSVGVAIVGGGPSLESTLPELRDQVFAGVKVCAVNGAYRWLIERNIKPAMQVVLDARPFNARFVDPAVPGCRYLLASQCAPETFEACENRDTTIFHCVGSDEEDAVIKAHYDGHYHAVGGGTTVMLRAITLLRMLGFFRMDIYGMDSCWLEGKHHAYGQPENDHDQAHPVWLVPKHPMTGESLPERKRKFLCDPWHMKQAEEFQSMVKAFGHMFLLNVHGDGLIANMLRMGAEMSRETMGGV